MITQFGAIVKRANTDKKLIEEYKNMSVLETYNKFHKCHFKRPLYTFNSDYLFFPRFLAVNAIEKCVSRLAVLPEVDFKQVGTLQKHQTEIAEIIMRDYFNPDMLKKGAGGVILKLDMGAGKSFIAMGLINLIRRKTLIICHVSNMISQWRENLEKWFEGVQVGEMSGRVKKDGQIVIGLIQTLSKERIGKQIPNYEYFSQFGCIIFDEAHLYCSESYSRIFNTCQVQYMIGLSGTPYHEDGSHKIIEWNIGPIFDADALELASTQKFNAEVELLHFSASQEFCQIIKADDGSVIYQPTLDLILSNPARIDLLVAKIIKLANERNVFVFSDRRQYLEILQKRILAESEHNMALIMGGSTDADLEKAVEESRIIGTTYQFMSTGRSISKMNGLVFATPRKMKVEQTLGRIFRSGSGSETRKIIDLIDNRTILMSQAKARKAIYYGRGYTIKSTYA